MPGRATIGRAHARAAFAVSAVLALAACGPTQPGPGDPTHVAIATPGPALGLTWDTALAVERPEVAFALPSVIPLSSGEGRSGHPGHFPGQSVMDDVVALRDAFVAVGYTYPGWTATAWTSADGRRWRTAPISDQDATFPVTVTAGHGMVLAVGRHGPAAASWTTADGTTWEQHDVTPQVGSVAERMTAVVSTTAGFVAGGSSGPELGERRAAFWRSVDGRTWQGIPDDPAFANAEVTDVVLTATGLVAVGVTGAAGRQSGSTAWTSSDGVRWTRSDSPALIAGRAVALAATLDGTLVAVGSDLEEGEALAWRSPDGLTWLQAPREATRHLDGRKVRMTDVAVAGDRIVAVGNHVGLQYGTASSWVSRDGMHWTRSTDTPALEQGELSAVVAGGPGLVSVGTFGAPDNYIPQVWLSPGLP